MTATIVMTPMIHMTIIDRMTMIGDKTMVTKVLALVLAVESAVEDTITMIALGLEQVLLPEVAIQAERAKRKVKLNGMSGTKMTAHGERERKETTRVEKIKAEKITVGKWKRQRRKR